MEIKKTIPVFTIKIERYFYKISTKIFHIILPANILWVFIKYYLNE